jgi:hypothetical protein
MIELIFAMIIGMILPETEETSLASPTSTIVEVTPQKSLMTPESSESVIPASNDPRVLYGSYDRFLAGIKEKTSIHMDRISPAQRELIVERINDALEFMYTTNVMFWDELQRIVRYTIEALEQPFYSEETKMVIFHHFMVCSRKHEELQQMTLLTFRKEVTKKLNY